MIAWTTVLADEAEPVVGLPPFAVFPTDERVAARSLLAELPLLAVVAVLIAFVVKTFVAQAFYIPSESMVPQLLVNDRVVVSKLAYDLHGPRRGDVVVFDCPPLASCGTRAKPDANSVRRLFHRLGEAVGLVQPSTDEYIKRVVGLPGDVVQGRAGIVVVNGRSLIEPYLPSGTFTSDFGPITVPAGSLWVMGDNRTRSADSRFFGTIRQTTVVGRAFARIWPLNRTSFL